MYMVVKTIVVRNLFSFEYDGSNPSLPTNKVQAKLVFYFKTKNKQKFEGAQ